MATQTLVFEGTTQFAVIIDESGDLTYVGHADPGTATSAALWRIRRLDASSDPDLTIMWADGDDSFDNVWDNRATLSYS